LRIKKGSAKSALLVGIFTVLLAFVIGIGSEIILNFLSSFWVGLVLLLIIIFLGIFFDLLGTAVTAATAPPFNAMASKKIKGATQAVRLLNNAGKFANYCNDVIGDVCGTLSGAVGAGIVVKVLAAYPFIDAALLSALITGCIAGLTVGGKAFGKNIALNYSNQVIFRVAVVMAFVEKKVPITFFKNKI
jgi:CBS domain containing-hemolysin-like protein